MKHFSWNSLQKPQYETAAVYKAYEFTDVKRNSLPFSSLLLGPLSNPQILQKPISLYSVVFSRQSIGPFSRLSCPALLLLLPYIWMKNIQINERIQSSLS